MNMPILRTVCSVGVGIANLLHTYIPFSVCELQAEVPSFSSETTVKMKHIVVMLSSVNYTLLALKFGVVE